MKIAVLGATGRAGSEITAELVRRGHDALAISRHPHPVAGARIATGDASDPDTLAPLIKESDAVISALHFDIPAKTILEASRKAGVDRLLVTGGAASLHVPSGQRLIDTPDFPEEFRSFAEGGIVFLDALRQETAIDWTFLSPPALLLEGPRLGHYRVGKDDLLVNDKGESTISFADYAMAMVDELENHRYSRTRFTVAY